MQGIVNTMYCGTEPCSILMILFKFIYCFFTFFLEDCIFVLVYFGRRCFFFFFLLDTRYCLYGLYLVHTSLNNLCVICFCSMAAAFGSGFIFSLVSSSGGPNIPGAVGTGAFFAILQGGIHKVTRVKVLSP